MAKYQEKKTRYYNQKVKPRVFKQGDLVLGESEASDPLHRGKLMPRWEGPYQVQKII